MFLRSKVVFTQLLAVGLASTLIASALFAAEEAVEWKQSAEIAAPEAHQAAAADEKFAYAISSVSVAKYDRASGKRLALSTDSPSSVKATHLNSGFIKEGQLYCAHSNYPKKPEQSQIMALDLKTMALTVFKDFGNFGGSLTWGVFHDGHWWCNFAKYGDENAATFLVKFDDKWNELARWKYPPEVIRELGRNSISGGVWRDGALLVTGHDEPMLYRVRLPAKGTVLEYLDRQPAPFTGQGIALDPKTGGLVGIQRGKQKLVFATRQTNSPEPAK